MDTSGNRSARRTQTNASGRPDRNNGLITFVVRTLHNKPTRHQTGAVECLLHGADSPPNQSAKHPETASKVSQSQNCTPNNIRLERVDPLAKTETTPAQWQLREAHSSQNGQSEAPAASGASAGLRERCCNLTSLTHLYQT